MIAPQVTALIAADRIAERQRRARAAYLAALARGCRLSTWGQGARRAAPGLARPRAIRRDRHAAVCCT